MANEFFRAYGGDAAISLAPGANGRFEVYLDGEKSFDRKEEGNIFPELGGVREVKSVILAKLEAIPAAAD